MTPQEIFNIVHEKFGDAVYDYKEVAPQTAEAPAKNPKAAKKAPSYFDPHFFVKPERTAEVATFMKENETLFFDALMSLSGVDPKEGKLRAVYHLFSYRHRHKITIKADVTIAEPTLPTVSKIWGVANWFEREIFDLFGIQFDGHPNLQRLLLPDDWEGFPLRKDYVKPTHYHGLDNTRDPWEDQPANLLAGQTEPTDAIRKFTELGLQTNRTDHI